MGFEERGANAWRMQRCLSLSSAQPSVGICCWLQAEELTAAGHVPDKVIMLEGAHALLLNRVKYRRIDYSTGEVSLLCDRRSSTKAARFAGAQVVQQAVC